MIRDVKLEFFHNSQLVCKIQLKFNDRASRLAGHAEPLPLTGDEDEWHVLFLSTRPRAFIVWARSCRTWTCQAEEDR